MQRVSIVGTSGSGKSTLGRDLAGALNVPFVELDSVFHQPGRYLAASQDPAHSHLAFIRLTSPRAVRRFLAEARARAAAGSR